MMEDPWPALSPATAVIPILALALVSGFFSLFEQALRAARKSRLHTAAQGGEQRRPGGGKKYRDALAAVETPGPYIAAARIWVCVLRTFAALLAGASVMRHFSAAGPLGALLIAASALALAAVMLLLGDLLPHGVARAAPEQIAAVMLPLFSLFALPIRPLYALARRLGGVVRSAVPPEARRPGITEDELRIALDEGEKSGIVESRERDMVEGVFYLGDRPVGAFMTHRSEIQWLDVSAGLPEIRARVLEYRSQSCFPVADGTLDAIIGAAYVEDIILATQPNPPADGDSPADLRTIMKKAQFIPETMPALKAFESFKRGETNFLFVMDEYGGFAGVISLRDLMEEIVGELAAPQREADLMVRREDGSWLAGGSLNIDDAAKLLALPDLAAEHAGYHTLAGFVLSLAGELPRAGDSFVYRGYRFTVAEMDGHRIDRLVIKREEGY